MMGGRGTDLLAVSPFLGSSGYSPFKEPSSTMVGGGADLLAAFPVLGSSGYSASKEPSSTIGAGGAYLLATIITEGWRAAGWCRVPMVISRAHSGA